MDYDNYIKWVYYPVLLLIVLGVAFILVGATLNSVMSVTAEENLPRGIKSFTHNGVTCYYQKDTHIDLLATGVVGGMSCVKK